VSPAILLARLSEAGGSLIVRDGKPIVCASRPLPPEFLAELRAHKADLVRLLLRSAATHADASAPASSESPAVCPAIVARGNALLAEVQRNPATRIIDLDKARQYFRGRAAAELAAEARRKRDGL
jgi:hypothetical protein